MPDLGAEAREWRAKIGRNWFLDVCANVDDPAAAYSKWDAWISALAEHPSRPGPQVPIETRVRGYLLGAATGICAASVRNYLRGTEKELGETLREELRRIDHVLGFGSSVGRVDSKAIRLKRRGIRRIGVMTEFKDLPSLRYHQNVIRSLLDGTRDRNVSLAMHEVSRSNVSESVMRFVRIHKYDGLIFIRLTPDQDLCAFLAEQQVPVVTIHADMRTYLSPPVLSNIHPLQKGIETLLRGHLAECLRSKSAPRVVLIHMPKEGTEGSIRDERIAYVERALNSPHLGAEVITQVVEDYGFRRAIEVYEKHSDADFFACLSDELAVALKHLLQATAKRRRKDDWKHKIIGFDNSLAPQEGITSFNQHIEQIGLEVMRVFDQFFDLDPKEPSEWPPFEPRGIPVSLSTGD
jgi:DNA-binding LacI/PurR family transcriptional regulator